MARQSSPSKHRIRGVALIVAEIAILLYLAIDGALNFVVRPLWRVLGRIPAVSLLGKAIASLPAYGVLAVLAVPFAVAEPAKVFAVVLMTRGHMHMGLVIMVGAYAMSLMVVDRIYKVGEAKLRTIPWFAKVTDWLFSLRDSVLDWARRTQAWQTAAAMKERAAALFATVWHRLKRHRRSRGRREA